MKIAIFISGAGSLIPSFINNKIFDIKLILANKECEGLNKADEANIEWRITDKIDRNLALYLNKLEIKTVVLAGFLKIVPTEFLHNFKGLVVNVHPSLLPKYGGVGYYGDKVHQAVLENNEQESGITIHKVSSVVDSGEIIAQFKVLVDKDETVLSLRKKIQQLEQEKYNQIVATL